LLFTEPECIEIGISMYSLIIINLNHNGKKKITHDKCVGDLKNPKPDLSRIRISKRD